MGKMKELFMEYQQYQEENNNTDYTDYIHHLESELDDNMRRLIQLEQNVHTLNTNDTDSILQYFDKISEN